MRNNQDQQHFTGVHKTNEVSLEKKWTSIELITYLKYTLGQSNTSFRLKKEKFYLDSHLIEF